jgi:hypothetical protein
MSDSTTQEYSQSEEIEFQSLHILDQAESSSN